MQLCNFLLTMVIRLLLALCAEIRLIYVFNGNKED